MHDPTKLRELAHKCRERAQSSANPASAEQLQRWAVELADAADRAEWNVNDPGAPGIDRLRHRRVRARGEPQGRDPGGRCHGQHRDEQRHRDRSEHQQNDHAHHDKPALIAPG